MNERSTYFLIATTSILVCLTILFFSLTSNTSMTSADTTFSKPTIVIDPGHGGEDSGAVNNNILEKDINLAISCYLRDYFVANGFNVIMTRKDDVSLNDKSKKYSKQQDLKNRVEVFNSSKNNVVISIHQNKFTDSKYHGTQIFYSDNNKQNSVLAENLRSSVVNLLQPDNQRECKLSGSEIYILDNTDVPAILIECGFLSNKNEAEKLNRITYQKQLAYSIFLGFLEYYYTNY